MNQLRVSVATYNRVIFFHPEHGTTMLALERKATVSKDGSVKVRAQPFGGGVRILDPRSLEEMLGGIHFDSERSKLEQDFRILIPPSKWEAIRKYCLLHLENLNDSELESTPDRELTEEFEETLHMDLKPGQYVVKPMGFVIEDNPVWTENWYARGFPTVRVYRIHEVQIIDAALCESMLAVSPGFSDQHLEKLAVQDAQQGGRGWANSVLTLALDKVTEAYLALPPEMRYRKIHVEEHELEESVLTLLEDVNVPQYQRVNNNKTELR